MNANHRLIDRRGNLSHPNELCTAIIHPFALISLFLLSNFGLLAPSTARSGELRSGRARIDITPEQPVTMAGYESRKDLSKGVHDSLSARAIAFEKDGKKLVLISIDNLGFYGGTAEPLRKSVLDMCGLAPDELFLCAIHTHSAPSLTLDPSRGHANNVQYTKDLGPKLAELAKSAMGRLEPVRLGIGSGSSPVGVNRREVVQDREGRTRIVLGRNPMEMTDREVQVLALGKPGKETPAALLFASDTHSTSLGPGNYMISGDVHGTAEQFLEKYFGTDLVAPGFAGPSGNIDPWVRVLPDFRTNNGWVPETVLMGTMLGEEVARVSEKIRFSDDNGQIKTTLKTVQLPAKPRGTNAAPASGTSPITLSAACIGDLAFVGWGGEVFNEIGKAVKESSPFKQTFIFTHCNGAGGYLPIRRAYQEGGYEVQSSPFGIGAAEQLIQETLKTLRELKEAQK